jgi:predicted Zn-dependent protease
MRTSVAVLVLLLLSAPLGGTGLAKGQAAYPESEAAAAWRALAAGYVRKALKDQALNEDPVLNARVDAVMATVGRAVGAIDPRFAGATWKAILIEDFGRGAAAFPGETILVDASFVRALRLDDHELALILCHEAAHVLAGHALAKLSFMAGLLGKEKLPDARSALVEYLAKDSYATVFQPTAREQEREADMMGAAIFFATGYDPLRALGLFDKLAARETGGRDGAPDDTHDSARVRKSVVAGVIVELQRLQAGRRLP